jgi:hypothetical protein
MNGSRSRINRSRSQRAAREMLTEELDVVLKQLRAVRSEASDPSGESRVSWSIRRPATTTSSSARLFRRPDLHVLLTTVARRRSSRSLSRRSAWGQDTLET